jgi:glycosyltransferase involved in cell wall biosynthesis
MEHEEIVDKINKYAYTTILSTDSYLPGILALFESIKKTNTKITDFVVLVNQEIKQETIKTLEKNGIIVKRMPKVNVPQEIKSKNKLFPHWNNTFDKFNVFNLIDYDKVVYLDSDIYVAENIDELFQKPNMSAVVSGKSFPINKYWNELNSGVMVIEPKEGIREDLINKMNEMAERKFTLKKPHKVQEKKKFFSNISLLKLKDKICKRFQGIGDQDVLEEFFDWKNKSELHLDESFNVFNNYSDYYKEKIGITPKCYHFIGEKKPWSLTPKEIQKITKYKSKTKPVEYKAFNAYKNIIYDNADKNKTNFSIIIPMKNAEQYINNALSSIKSQNYENAEILVIDDKSTDNSKNVLKKFCLENPKMAKRIKILETPEGHDGPGAARNVGLDNATGDYILFLDADDKLNENALNNISRTINLNPEFDIFSLGYQLTRLGFNEEKISNMELNSGKLQESRFFQIGANTSGQIWNVCARRSLYEKPTKVRFKENCKFEDLPTKVNLFTKTHKKIKSVPYITHTQYSRPVKSITGTLKIQDIKRLIDANLEIANIRPEVDSKDKMYINMRMIMMPIVLSWLVQKCIHNKIDLYRMQKTVQNEKL